jgi:hypothetical protein
VLVVTGHPMHSPATGTLVGSYTMADPMPDVGMSYSLTGQGAVAGLGRVSVNGSVHSLGFMAEGEAGGTITLSNHRGSLTLQLLGPMQAGFSPLPTAFSYTVTGSTGAYMHVRGSGKATLQLRPFLVALFCLPGPKACMPPAGGSFTLTLKQG